MNLNQVSLFNTAPVEEHTSLPGSFLPRYPKAVRHSMSDRGRFVSAEAIGIEIRFVTSSPNIRFHFQNATEAGELLIYRGDFLIATHQVESGKVQTFFVETPPRFSGVKKEMLSSGGFSSDVWRLFFGRYELVFLGLDTFGHPVRPPLPEELPQKKWLAYGSSITHSNANGYPFVAARQLGLDVMNKGLSGACQIEKDTTDFLSTLPWDLATLELGVNMRDSFTPEEFEKRSKYLIEKLRATHPQAKMAVITMFPNFCDWELTESLGGKNQKAYNEILRRLVKNSGDKKLFLFEGADILSSPAGLGQDLIHPTLFGHAQMGGNLARLIQERLLS